jgi:hypothetical protein
MYLMRKRLLSLVLTVLTLALPLSALAGTTNAPAKPGGLPPELNDFLRTADSFILFSIEPIPGGQAPSTNTFCGRIVVGQLTIRRPETRANLIDALDKGIRAIPPSPPGVPVFLPDCFFPRHGIRAIKGDETVELLICFECSQVQVSSNKNRSWFFMTDKKPATTFNGILKRNHIALPKH